jgi:lysylphosphatidylglycerol synthetase-like protein (DUF2156 family)
MNTLLFTKINDGGELLVPKLNVGHIFAGLVLSTLIYLTALQWNAAFTLSVQKLQTKHQELNEEEASYVIASSITVFVVLITIIIYFALRKQTLKIKKQNKA